MRGLFIHCIYYFLCILLNTQSILNESSLQESHHEVKEIIQIIKQRLNVISLTCRYRSSLYLNPEISFEDHSIQAIEYNFFYQEGNYLISKFEIPDNQNVEYLENKPSNLLELLGYNYYKSRISRSHSSEKSKGHYDNYYFYKNKPKHRIVDSINNPGKVWFGGIEDNMRLEAPYGNPLWLIGYIDFYLDVSVYALDYSPPKRIVELLDIPGEAYLRKEGKNKVLIYKTKNLWFNKTKCSLEPSILCNIHEEYIKNFCFEVWIDENTNIIKIIEIDYFPLIYSETLIKKLCGNINTQFHPYEIRRIFEFEQFQNFQNGVRIPLRGTITTFQNPHRLYKTIVEKPSGFALDYISNKITAEEYRILSSCYGADNIGYFSVVSIEIEPETLKVNEPIPESVFIAPEITIKDNEIPSSPLEENKNKKTYYNAIFFITGCVLITLVAIFLTRRYFGWGA